MNVSGALVDDRECCNLTPLHWAAWGGHSRIVQVSGNQTIDYRNKSNRNHALTYVAPYSIQMLVILRGTEESHVASEVNLITTTMAFTTGPSCFWCTRGYKGLWGQYTTDTRCRGWVSGNCAGDLMLGGFVIQTPRWSFSRLKIECHYNSLITRGCLPLSFSGPYCQWCSGGCQEQ